MLATELEELEEAKAALTSQLTQVRALDAFPVRLTTIGHHVPFSNVAAVDRASRAAEGGVHG